MNILEVNNLVTEFKTHEAQFNAIDQVSISIEKGKTLGLVGESGCGKSVTSLSIMRLIQKPGKITSGEVLFHNQNLLKLTESEILKLRGRKISMIFQEPMTSLNPVFSCGAQISEVLKLHFPDLSKEQLKNRSIDLLKTVGIPSPEQRYNEYPHQLSGGMRQRVMIAMAISCEPELLIADEPTTALDVTIQAQILDLLRKLQAERQMSMLLITHDLGVVAEMCDDVAVMYAGKIVEYKSRNDLFKNPQHPYTVGLLRSVPDMNDTASRLQTIAGYVPNLSQLPKGCRFQDRCSKKTSRCESESPELTQKFNAVACWNPYE